MRHPVPDVLAHRLDLVFVGINPGRASAAARAHFAGSGNRFWRALHLAGMTDRLLAPAEQHLLLEYGIGITNLVARATSRAADLEPRELREGGVRLERKLARLRPRAVAFLGLGAYRVALGRPWATIGLQPEPFARARAFALPNPSGLNAAYRLEDLARLYAETARAG